MDLSWTTPIRRGMLVGDDRGVLGWDIEQFLEELRERRKDQPLPRIIPWEKRPRWDGKIINLTQVNRDE